ncbi:DUF4190 domain-containing protein [Janibacter melonis]|uniref:DUF4190 domain-containing protein n=1 Tax=Janibacter melonis TaxID=262209 RepID=UPI00191A6E75|nr:DUF4190 domain-containing protein [Janibacter melonis]
MTHEGQDATPNPAPGGLERAEVSTPSSGGPPIEAQPTPFYPHMMQVPPEHPQATTVLALGIAAITVVPFTAPFAWILGTRALRQIDANPGAYSRRDFVVAGRIIGMVATIAYALILLLILYFVLSGPPSRA